MPLWSIADIDINVLEPLCSWAVGASAFSHCLSLATPFRLPPPSISLRLPPRLLCALQVRASTRVTAGAVLRLTLPHPCHHVCSPPPPPPLDSVPCRYKHPSGLNLPPPLIPPVPPSAPRPTRTPQLLNTNTHHRCFAVCPVGTSTLSHCWSSATLPHPCGPHPRSCGSCSGQQVQDDFSCWCWCSCCCC